MTIVGYAQDPSVAIVESEAVLESLVDYPEVHEVAPGSNFCTFEISKSAPKTLISELCWFVEQARTYLTSIAVVGDFPSEEHYRVWFSSLSEEQQALVKHDRNHFDNISRTSRLVAGLTTEAFAKQLHNQTVHDSVIATYTEFNRLNSLTNFYALSGEERLAIADALVDCITRVIRLLERVDFIKCEG